MTLPALRQNLLLMQDERRETRQRASEKIAAIRKFFMMQQGGVDLSTFQCHYCDEYCPREEMTVDHIVPWSVCRITALWNAAFVCLTCNRMKANEMEWCICDRCQAALARWSEMQQEQVAS